MKYIIGVDPGKTGAVAAVPMNGVECGVWDMPETEQDLFGLYEDIVFHVGIPHAVYVELVHAMPKQGVSSSFRFGMEFGKARMFAALFQCRWVLVSPTKWKRSFSLTRDKANAIELVKRLYPRADVALKKHHSRAEAILIAEYGRREETRGTS